MVVADLYYKATFVDKEMKEMLTFTYLFACHVALKHFMTESSLQMSTFSLKFTVNMV